jgi:hypothetical protein
MADDTNQQQAPEGEGSGQPPIGDALASVMRMVFERGQSRAEALAADGRGRLELRQLRKDRDTMYQKLGREVRRLVEAGELEHPGIVRGIERIEGVESRIAEVEARHGALVPGASEGEEGA